MRSKRENDAEEVQDHKQEEMWRRRRSVGKN